MRHTLLIAAILFGAISVSAQQTVTITATKDNTLYEDANGATSNGSGIYLFAGKTGQASNSLRRTVIKFDLIGQIPIIPINATITGAKLKMNMSKSITGASNVSVYRLNSDWGEGTSDAGAEEGRGAAAATNDATWKHKFFSTQNWSALGGDYISSPSATSSVSGTGSYEWSDTLLRADVVSWFKGQASNFGWIIIGNETAQSAKRFDSRNNSVDANRPKLIVEYTLPMSVREISSTPEVFALQQNYPNPFNPSTTIYFSLPQSGLTTLNVYDVLGNEVAELVNQRLSAGTHSVDFNGKNLFRQNAGGLASGVYFYRLQSANNVSTKKLILVK